MKLLRFSDLSKAGVVKNWPQLKRLVALHGFPPGFLLSPNARVWDERDVEAWLQSRRDASASTKPLDLDAAHAKTMETFPRIMRKLGE